MLETNIEFEILFRNFYELLLERFISYLPFYIYIAQKSNLISLKFSLSSSLLQIFSQIIGIFLSIRRFTPRVVTRRAQRISTSRRVLKSLNPAEY